MPLSYKNLRLIFMPFVPDTVPFLGNELRSYCLRPPGGAGSTAQNFCGISAFCITYRHPQASSSMEAAAGGGGCRNARHLGLRGSCRQDWAALAFVRQRVFMPARRDTKPRGDSRLEKELRETKPIREGVSGLKCQVSSESIRSAGTLPPLTSHFTLKTSNRGGAAAPNKPNFDGVAWRDKYRTRKGLGEFRYHEAREETKPKGSSR